MHIYRSDLTSRLSTRKPVMTHSSSLMSGPNTRAERPRAEPAHPGHSISHSFAHQKWFACGINENAFYEQGNFFHRISLYSQLHALNRSSYAGPGKAVPFFFFFFFSHSMEKVYYFKWRRDYSFPYRWPDSLNHCLKKKVSCTLPQDISWKSKLTHKHFFVTGR